MERKSQDMENIFRDFFESTPVGLLTLDSKGIILEANLTAADILHVNKNELKGKPFTGYIAPDYLATFILPEANKSSSISSQKCEIKLRRTDGSFLNVCLYVTPKSDAARDAILYLVTIIDVSEIDQLAQKYLIPRADISKILNAIPIPLTITSLPDRKYVEVNDKFLKTGNLTREEVIGHKVQHLIRWVDPEKAKEVETEMIEKGDISDVEMQIYHISGEVHTSLMSAKKIEMDNRRYLLSTSIDITARKRAEEALKESETFNASILDESPNPILVTNLDNSIRYVNPALERLTGYSASEIIGIQPPFPWWPPEKSAEYILSEANFAHEDTLRRERYFLSRNGELFWVIIQVKKIILDGQIRYYLSNWVDITENKKNEELIKLHELQLRTVLDSLTEGVSLINPEGTIIQANRAELKILGLKSTEGYIGGHFRQHKNQFKSADGKTLPSDESVVFSVAKRKRAVHNFELGLVKDDGSVLWLNINAVPIIDSSGKVQSVVRSISDITEQKRLMDEREQFTRKLLDVQEEERKRISRELHDDTAQYLALLKLEIDSIIDKEKSLPPETQDKLNKLRASAEKALTEVRRFSHELRPSVLEHFGLTSALETITSEFKNSCQTDLRFESEGAERRLPSEIELALFRIAQEAMSNIRKHAEATKATVRIIFNRRKVKLTIADNGKGFTIPKTAHHTGKGSLGLIGMRERAHLIGANLKLRSNPDKGTTISVDMEIPEE